MNLGERALTGRRVESHGRLNQHFALSALCSLVLLGLLCGCGGSNNTGTNGGGGTGGSGGSGGSGGGGGTPNGVVNSTWPEDGEGQAQALVMHTQSLTTNQCLINPNGGFNITQTTTFIAFTYSQYKANYWALDQNDAQLCQNGQAFTGYPLVPQGQNGVQNVTLPAGSYFIGIQDVGNTSNSAGAELDVNGGPPNTSFVGSTFTPVTKSLNPGGWEAIPFTIQSGNLVWLDGGNTGGQVYMMNPSQESSFASQYANGFNGGTINFIEDAYNNSSYCGLNGSSNSDAPEDCDLTSHLPPGSYYLVYINNTSSPQWFTAWALTY